MLDKGMILLDALLWSGSQRRFVLPGCSWSQWFTHVAYIEDGTVSKLESRDECSDFQARLKSADTAPLLRTIEGWLRAEKNRKIAERKAKLALADSTESKDEDAKAASAGSGNSVADRTSMSAGQGNGFSAGRMAAYISMTE
jgi:hypothetical protein